MTDNKDLLKELSDQLQVADDYLNRLDESKALPDELLSEYQLDLLALQNKHIPAELCSSDELIERIDEVASLIDNVK
jgi:RNAse (barnase) inhibitor barstar